ncbi:MAG TPA: DLW-39 family protein [Mycobacteriales bacterium]|nr:DLW-39 family protein [Mycobacteriales bacterium]
MIKRLALVAAVAGTVLLVLRKLRTVREERELWQEAMSAPYLPPAAEAVKA